MATLEVGQIWEFVNSSVNSDGSVSRYELENFDRKGRYGRAELHQVDDPERHARITAEWLLQGENRAPFAHWRLVS